MYDDDFDDEMMVMNDDDGMARRRGSQWSSSSTKRTNEFWSANHILDDFSGKYLSRQAEIDQFYPSLILRRQHHVFRLK